MKRRTGFDWPCPRWGHREYLAWWVYERRVNLGPDRSRIEASIPR